jgi:signal transduction histidine kinase
MGGTYDAADLLPMMARTVAQGVGARRVAVWLRIGGNLVEEASWPLRTGDEAAAPVPASKELSDIEGDLVVPVSHHGELLGAIAVAKPPAEPITPTEKTLLDDVSAQAGLVLSNVRLVEDLRSSRQRLVSAQDQERRRLERNLHDGAQQSLVSVALMLRMLRGRIDAEDAVRAAIDQASQQLGQAIDELRELARGIHPAILTDRGLGPALSALVERSPVPVVLRYDLEERPSGPVEGSLYFVVAEALTNVAKYARASQVTITVARTVDSVVLDVIDDGVGGADHRRGSGLSGLADRVAAVDGTLEIHSPPGGGTRLTCRIPVGPVRRQPDDTADGTRPPAPVGLRH